MGLFDFGKKFGKQLKGDVAGGLNLLSSAFIKPKETFSGILKLRKSSTRKEGAKSLVSTTKSLEKMPTSTKVFKTAKHTAIAAVAIGAPGTAKGRALSKVAAKKLLLGKTAVGTVAKSGTAITAAGLLATSKKARSAVVSAPDVAFKQGQNIGKAIEGKRDVPGTLGGKIKDFGIKAGLIAGGAAVVVGAGAIVKSKLSSMSESKTDVLKGGTPPVVPTKSDIITPTGTVKDTPKPTESVTPVTSQKAQRISQKVEVNQKVYKVASVDIKHGRRIKKRGRARRR